MRPPFVVRPTSTAPGPLRPMTAPSCSLVSQDSQFLKAVGRLPLELKEALQTSELVDAGLLAVYPRTHWRTLGLQPRGTWRDERARSSPPMALTSTVCPALSFPFSPSLSLSLPSSSRIPPSMHVGTSSVGLSVLVSTSPVRAADEFVGTGTGSKARRHHGPDGEREQNRDKKVRRSATRRCEPTEKETGSPKRLFVRLFRVCC